MVRTKVLSRSVSALLQQAQAFDLDFIAIANNGGGSEGMVPATRDVLRDAFHDVHIVEQAQQTGDDAGMPWSMELPLADGSRQPGRNRCFFIIQPLHELNAGKIRALRDVAHALHVEVLNGYSPDAIFQMDTETVLAFRPSGLSFHKSPLAASATGRFSPTAIRSRRDPEPVHWNAGRVDGHSKPSGSGRRRRCRGAWTAGRSRVREAFDNIPTRVHWSS
jgi:hypothetical protein